MDEKLWFLKSCPLFERLRAEEIEQLESRAKVASFAKKDLIYLPADAGDSVLLVTAGRVKLYHLTAEGKEAVLALIEPGELFGELAVFEGQQREEFAEAMLPTRIVRLPRQDVRSLMEAHPDVSLGVTKLMGLRRQRIERRLKSLLFQSNRERLTHLLIELAEKYGRQTPDGVELTIRLSHQELASIIGSTRETVTVVLGELQAERVVAVKRRQIILKDLAGLANSVDAPAPALPSHLPLAASPQ